MRDVEADTVVPSTLPEKPPSMSSVDPAPSPVFHVADMRALLGRGPRLTVIEYSKDSSNNSDLIVVL